MFHFILYTASECTALDQERGHIIWLLLVFFVYILLGFPLTFMSALQSTHIRPGASQ